MKQLAAFARLIRWPNLLFIVITQLLFYYCIYSGLFTRSFLHEEQYFFLLILSSVLIAAAGYIINDYFDMQIDTINKPAKMIMGKYMKRRWAILWHLFLSSLGILLSLFVGYKTRVWQIPAINILCVVMLWFYSVSLKKKLLSGNILVAVLTAWVVFVVYFFCSARLFSVNGIFETGNLSKQRFFKFTLFYAGFAFIMTIIREVIKDIEDMEGDRKYGCRTMPIVWGVPVAKVFTAVWLIVCIGGILIVLQVYAWQSGRIAAALYGWIFIVTPMIIVLRKLYAAKVSGDYHFISNLVKLIMLSEILSMLFIKSVF